MWTRALVLSLLAAPAWGFGPDLQDSIRDDDRTRLQALDSISGPALRHALAEGPPEDRTALVDAIVGAPLPPTEAMAGDWSCRMIKVSGGLPLVAYAPFRCRIGADGQFDKLTGSQRMTGRIGLLDGQPVYLGTGYIAGDDPVAYEDLPGDIDPAATPQRVPEVGVVEVVSPDRARILMPLPMLESDLNILMLTR